MTSKAIVKKAPVALALTIITFIIFNFAIPNMAALYILGDLGGSSFLASYSITFFGLGNALTMPLGAYFAVRFDQKLMIRRWMAAFILSTLLAGLAPTYPVFIIGRFLQGISSGALLIMVISVLSKLSTDEEKDRFSNFSIIIITTASVLGACYGGSIAYFLHWRMIFGTDVILLLVLDSWLIRKLDFEAIKSNLPAKAFDYVGYISFALSISSLIIYFTVGQEIDWLRAPLGRILLTTGVITTPFWIVWAFLHPRAIIPIKLFKNPHIAFGLFQFALLFSCYFGMLMLLALWLHLYVKYSVIWVSIVLFAMALTTLTVMIVLNSLKRKHTFPFLLLAIALFGLSCFLTSNFNAHVNIGRIAFSRIIAGIGLALFLPPIFHITLTHCKPCEGIANVTLLQITRVIGSGLGSAVYSIIWQRRFSFYHSRLGSNITDYSMLTKEKIHQLQGLGFSSEMSMAEISNALNIQAHSLALNDCFFLMGWILVGLFILATAYFAIIQYKATGESKA